MVSYDHLGEENRKDLTTALEIIKNREVLNRVRNTRFCWLGVFSPSRALVVGVSS